jgi:hypothetical protein
MNDRIILRLRNILSESIMSDVYISLYYSLMLGKVISVIATGYWFDDRGIVTCTSKNFLLFTLSRLIRWPT